jgi:hypothetical protein
MQLASGVKKLANRFKILKSVLPICAHCKRIRDRHGSWLALELHRLQHLNVELTHSICPQCAEKYYPDFYLPKA